MTAAVRVAPRGDALPAAAPSLDALLSAERARMRGTLRLAVGLAAGAVLIAGAALAGAALGDGRWIAMPALAPAAAWPLLALAAGALVWAAAPHVRRRSAEEAVARAIEDERALRAGALRAAREVAATGALGGRAADALAARLTSGRAGAPLAPAWQHEARRVAAAGAVACVGAALVLGASAAWTGDGLRALAHPIAAARGTLLPALRVLDAPARVARGRRVSLTVEASGRRRVDARWRSAGRGWTRRTLAVPPQGRAVLPLGAVDADITLVLDDGRARSDSVRIAVADRAFVGDVAVRAEYPAYLNRASEVVPAGDVVRVPRGTTLGVTARASARLAHARLTGPGGAVPLDADGAGLSGRLTPAASGRWAFEAADARGAADVPPPLDVTLLPDSAPNVVLASPTADTTIDGLGPVPVRVRAGDDHGLARVTLRLRIERADGQREPARTTNLVGASGPTWEGDAVVRPDAFDLAPGDRVRVQAVAVDASPWAQAGASRELVLRVPGAADLRAAARRAADSAALGASAAASAARALAERTSDAARTRGGSSQGAGTLQAAERARGLAAEQRQLGARVEAVREQAAALERGLRQSGALDSSLARQLADVQRLLRDALTPELARQLSDVERAAGQQNTAEMRASLEQLAARQRALREQLEQSGEMLRRAALEGAMQTLRDDARELAAAQERAAESLAGRQPNAGRQDRATRGDSTGAGDTAREQRSGDGPSGAESPRALAVRTRALAAEVDSLQRRLARAQAEPGAQRAGAAAREAARSAQSMAQAAERARAGQRQQNGQPNPQPNASENGATGGENGSDAGRPNPGAAAGARDAASAMRETAEWLAEARRQQVEDWKGELGDALDRAAQEAQQLAREQQQLARDARAGRDPAQLRAAQAAVQQGAEQAARRVEQAARRSSLLSRRAQQLMTEARQEVAEAGRALQQQQRPGGQSGTQPGAPTPGQSEGATPGGSASGGAGDAAAEMREAGEALGRAASALVRDRERVCGASSATGFEEMVAQMRQLAGQQGQINGQAAALPIPVPGAAGQPARDAARRLARQQRSVADQLGDLGEGDASGRSDAFAREARQLAQALERQAASGGSAPDPATLARQQQLYRKLLEAGRTLEQEERDEQGPREARAATGVQAVAPASGVESGRAGARYAPPAWTDLRALSADERRLVTEYFRRLNGGAGATP